MEFRIKTTARDWFIDISPKLTAPHGTTSAPDFDAFYFCFIAGIVAKRKEDASIDQTAELVDYFPGPYKNRGRLLVSLFLHKELEFLGIDLSEKKSVHESISRLVQPESSNYLSSAGTREFNRYAHGGYDVLLDWFDDRPRTLETFLRAFREKVEQSVITATHQTGGT